MRNERVACDFVLQAIAIPSLSSPSTKTRQARGAKDRGINLACIVLRFAPVLRVSAPFVGADAGLGAECRGRPLDGQDGKLGRMSQDERPRWACDLALSLM